MPGLPDCLVGRTRRTLLCQYLIPVERQLPRSPISSPFSPGSAAARRSTTSDASPSNLGNSRLTGTDRKASRQDAPGQDGLPGLAAGRRRNPAGRLVAPGSEWLECGSSPSAAAASSPRWIAPNDSADSVSAIPRSSSAATTAREPVSAAALREDVGRTAIRPPGRADRTLPGDRVRPLRALERHQHRIMIRQVPRLDGLPFGRVRVLPVRDDLCGHGLDGEAGPTRFPDAGNGRSPMRSLSRVRNLMITNADEWLEEVGDQRYKG